MSKQEHYVESEAENRENDFQTSLLSILGNRKPSEGNSHEEGFVHEEDSVTSSSSVTGSHTTPRGNCHEEGFVTSSSSKTENYMASEDRIDENCSETSLSLVINEKAILESMMAEKLEERKNLLIENYELYMQLLNIGRRLRGVNTLQNE